MIDIDAIRERPSMRIAGLSSEKLEVPALCDEIDRLRAENESQAAELAEWRRAAIGKSK